MNRPAFYASTGTVRGDLLAILHPPYTAWHLSFVAIGAALVPVDWRVLSGTMLALFLGTGVAAHALDELHGRPLGTRLSDGVLRGLVAGGFLGAAGLAVVGAFEISPWVLAWAGAGFALASGYALERPAYLHTPLGFALAWGGFPVLLGYWAQTQSVSLGAALVAGGATALSLAQRALSTPARLLRRSVDEAELRLVHGGEVETWDKQEILATWERPLRFLAWAMVILAIGLLVIRAG